MKPSLQKCSHLFRVNLSDFGTGADLTRQVRRVSRPHLLSYDKYAATLAAPIDLDLLDDLTDVARVEVLTQVLHQRRSEATFAMLIETLHQDERVIEQWRLTQCQIVDCHFDELSRADPCGLLIRLSIVAKQVSVNLHGETVVMMDVSARG